MVCDFCDCCYDYKGKVKVWKGKIDVFRSLGVLVFEVDYVKKMIVLFDLLQLVYKVIFNFFYGYVMRKGFCWYLMEMVGVICLMGVIIIQFVRFLVECFGCLLEFDMDGIWCMLLVMFLENFIFKFKNGKKMIILYFCVMLNYLVYDKFINYQYQIFVDLKMFKYEIYSDNFIFFEVDGLYKVMVFLILKEEDKNLKKCYVVFNDDGSFVELKGFEVK